MSRLPNPPQVGTAAEPRVLLAGEPAVGLLAALDGLEVRRDDVEDVRALGVNCVLVGPLAFSAALDTVRHLVSRTELEGAPVVAVLRGADDDEADALMAAGAFECLFERDCFRAPLQRALRRAAAHGALLVHSRTLDTERAAMLQQRHVGVARVSNVGTILEVNAAYAGFLGYAPGELVGRDIRSLVHAEDLAAFEQRSAAARTPEEGAYRAERRYVHRDGHHVWLQSDIAGIYGPDRRLRYFIGHHVDVTGRREAERALRERDERFRAALSAANGFVYEINLLEPTRTVAHGVRRLVGDVPPLAPGAEDWWTALMHPEDVPGFLRGRAEHLERGGGTMRLHYRVRRSDGEWLEVDDHRELLLDASGLPWKFAGTVMDVTERARTLAALARTEELFRVAATASRALVYELDVATGNATVIHNLDELLGYPADHTRVTFEWWRAHMHPDDVARLAPRHEAHLREGGVRRVEYRMRHADGSWRDVEDHCTVLLGQDGHAERMVGTVLDVTERRAAEDALREGQARLRLALDVGELATVTEDLEAGTYHFDRRARELFAYDESVTKAELFDRVHPDDRARLSAAFHAAVEPSSDGVFAAEYRIRLPDGSERWVNRRGIVIFAGDAEARRPIRALVTLRDITDQKRLQAAQQDFLAMASHELRNPLTTLKGYAQLIQRRGRYDQSATQALVEQADHLDRLVRDLLDVTTVTAGQFRLRRTPIDLVALVRDALRLQQLSTDRHRLSLRRAPERLEGAWDGDRLRQVLRNLLSNAVKYSPDGGAIEVDIERSGTNVSVSVEDHGIGIESSEQVRIFQRFYRVRTETGSIDGLGLGLDVTRALVEAHGGTVEVTSRRGEGSTFRITLPLTPAEARASADSSSPVSEAPSPAPSSAPRDDSRAPRSSGVASVSHAERVLIVDDDALVRRLLQTALQDEGYAVDVATDGEHALEVLHDRRCDVLVLDLMMPRLDGAGLVHRLRLSEREPDTFPRVVVLSASHTAREQAEALRADRVIEKPFELDRLLGTVRELLPAGDLPAPARPSP